MRHNPYDKATVDFSRCSPLRHHFERVLVLLVVSLSILRVLEETLEQSYVQGVILDDKQLLGAD